MSTTAEQFDFGSAVGSEDAFHPPLHDVLPKGNYRVKIMDVEQTTSSGNFPMLKIRLECADGVQWDNLVISPNGFAVRKLIGLTESAGLGRPDPAKGEIDASTGRLDSKFVARLQGKEVGVIVRDEEDNRPDHKGEMRPRVQGYQDPSKIESSGPAASAATPEAKATQAADAIPF